MREFSGIITAKKHPDNSLELRRDSVVRDKPKAGEVRGAVNIEKTKKTRQGHHQQGRGWGSLNARQASEKTQNQGRACRGARGTVTAIKRYGGSTVMPSK